MDQIKKEATTIMFVAVIILGWALKLEIGANAELSKINRQKSDLIHELRSEGSVLNDTYQVKSQANLILRKHIRGSAERKLLRDKEYLKIINKIN